MRSFSNLFKMSVKYWAARFLGFLYLIQDATFCFPPAQSMGLLAYNSDPTRRKRKIDRNAASAINKKIIWR